MIANILSIHNISVYHRDLKPDNILMMGDKVVLCDFGVSKKLDTINDFYADNILV